ncbi:MAG: hypothetical protein M0P58_04315 [Bacteroidales bacterium]|jgi:hypothetical protein|nr:hypothetical protein [Bacteroidales bacterium]
METFEKILVLNNEYEANLLEEVLSDKQIPHGIVPNEDSALGGIMELENGWGYVEAPNRYKVEITKLYKEISKK